MYENYVPWESGVPADLHTAVKALRESFDDAHFHFGSVTKNFCYALLHPDTVSQESVEYAEALVKLKERIGPAASQRFNETFALGTEPAIFKSLFDFYLEGLSTQVLLIFKRLAKIGREHESRLSAPHLEWAESQTKLLIGSNIHRIDIWVRAVCDTDPYDPAEDWDERISRTKWQAPRFLIMKPSRNDPYDAARAWERVDAATSMRWRKTFYEDYVRHLELKLRNLAGDAAVELAMQPKINAQSAAATHSIHSNQEHDATRRPHQPGQVKTPGRSIGRGAMRSPQNATMRHRLSSLRAIIQSFESDLSTAHVLAKPNIELLISFYKDAEQTAKNEIELHELAHGGLDARRRACESPERYVTNAPAPPITLSDRSPARPRQSREERIAWKKTELEAELQKAEMRSLELEAAIRDWYLQALPEWDRVTADARRRWTDNQRLAIEQYGALKLQYEQMLGAQDCAASPEHLERDNIAEQGNRTAGTEGGDKAHRKSQANPIQESAIQPKSTTPKVSNRPSEASRESLLKQIQNAPDGQCFKTALAARALDVSVRTIPRRVKDGKLTVGAKRGTITASSLRRLLKISRPPAN